MIDNVSEILGENFEALMSKRNQRGNPDFLKNLSCSADLQSVI